MRDTHLTRILCQRGLKLVDFARLVGVDKATVSRWSAGRIPAERLADIEVATGIDRADLRPDLYPPAAPVSACDAAPRTIGGADARA